MLGQDAISLGIMSDYLTIQLSATQQRERAWLLALRLIHQTFPDMKSNSLYHRNVVAPIGLIMEQLHTNQVEAIKRINENSLRRFQGRAMNVLCEDLHNPSVKAYPAKENMLTVSHAMEDNESYMTRFHVSVRKILEHGTTTVSTRSETNIRKELCFPILDLDQFAPAAITTKTVTQYASVIS